MYTRGTGESTVTGVRTYGTYRDDPVETDTYRGSRSNPKPGCGDGRTGGGERTRDW